MNLDKDGVSTCAGACARAWPAASIAGNPVAGEGVTAALTAVDSTLPLALGGNGGALALIVAWAIPDLLSLRAGEEIEGDLLGTAVVGVVVAPADEFA